jgi:rRNA biogenesis protein RRP5
MLLLAVFLQEGTKLSKVLVLEQLRGSGTLIVSCKPSLMDAADSLPKSLDDLTEASILPGYVTNVVADAVFVRFLGGLTGRAGDLFFFMFEIISPKMPC